jgi:hypothetical protein
VNSKIKPKADSKSTAHVGLEKVLFDVPVYRLSKQKYESQQNDYIRKEIEENGGKYANDAYRLYPELKTSDESHLWANYGGCWLFNEIVGFIRLYFYSGEIRGEYWHVSAKIIVRTRRKIFYPLGQDLGFGERIPYGSSNSEIYERIGFFLDRAQREKNLKNRHVDRSVFDNIGQHVFWKNMLKVGSL